MAAFEWCAVFQKFFEVEMRLHCLSALELAQQCIPAGKLCQTMHTLDMHASRLPVGAFRLPDC